MCVASYGVMPQTNIETRRPWSGTNASFLRESVLYTRIVIGAGPMRGAGIKVRRVRARRPGTPGGADVRPGTLKHDAVPWQAVHGGLPPPPADVLADPLVVPGPASGRAPPRGRRRDLLVL